MLSRRRIRLRQAGDTIVEVVVAVAVISLVLVAAYTTTRSSVTANLEAQERAQASKLAQSQLEYLRNDQGKLLSDGQCYYLNAGVLATATTAFEMTGHCSLEADGITEAPTVDFEPTYNLSISKTGTTYTITTKWHGIRSKIDNVTYYYRLD